MQGYIKMERVLPELHDLILKCRNELHILDGTSIEDYTEFKNKELDKLAGLIHKVYALAVDFKLNAGIH